MKISLFCAVCLVTTVAVSIHDQITEFIDYCSFPSSGERNKVQGRYSSGSTISYTKTGFSSLAQDSWTRISLNVGMSHEFYNLFAVRIDQFFDMGYSCKTTAQSFFQELSGDDTIPLRECPFKEWSEWMKPKFQEIENEIQNDLRQTPESIWSQLWANTDAAKFFIDIFVSWF